MVLFVAPALVPDIEKLYDIYFDAFGHDEMGKIMSDILFPSGITPEFRKHHTAFTLEWWKTCNYQYTLKCVDSENGEIVGMGFGDLIIPKEGEKIEYPGVTWLEGEERARAERILQPLWQARQRIWEGKPYIYIHVVCVDPKHQGRGAGLRLVQWGVEVSERSGLPIYLESSPTTVKLYERVGMRRLKEEIVHKASDLGTTNDVTVPLVVYVPTTSKCSLDQSMFRKRPSWRSQMAQRLLIAWWNLTNFK